MDARFRAEVVAARLARRRIRDPRRGLGDRRAAVAALLRLDGGHPMVLLMERAERVDDRWSGHVALPGGREEPGDADLYATAVRETAEEVGIDLAAGARLLGRLPPVRAILRGKLLPMTISPFVFVETAAQPIRPNHEVASTFWLPLDRAAAGALDGTYPHRLGPLPLELPCWRWDGKVVWGLTYQMLRALLAALA
jgi:8-oxo-dGTP pyrophosphatase MutT (NUDIX family)